MNKIGERTITTTPQITLTDLLDQIESRANAATPGPWDFHGQSRTFAVSHVINGVHRPRVIKGDIDCDEGEDWRTSCGGVINMKDAKFIAAARTDLPALVKALRKMMTLFENPHQHYDTLKAEVAAIFSEQTRRDAGSVSEGTKSEAATGASSPNDL